MDKIKNIIRQIRIQIIRILSCGKRRLPIKERILIIAPHPDDEVLGCSGLIQRSLKEGKPVDVVILSGGGKSHSGCCSIDEKELVESRRALSRTAAGILGLPLNHLHFLDYPDGEISFDCPETRKLKILIDKLRPKAIFIPHKGEGWNDHLAAGDIVKKLIGEDSCVELYEYCVWFWYYNTWNIDWKNACVLKMNRQDHTAKNRAIDAYIQPVAPCGRPWSGVLPKVFVGAKRWRGELYFRER